MRAWLGLLLAFLAICALLVYVNLTYGNAHRSGRTDTVTLVSGRG
jgi:ABC-type transporter Mla subunit MlaD